MSEQPGGQQPQQPSWDPASQPSPWGQNPYPYPQQGGAYPAQGGYPGTPQTPYPGTQPYPGGQPYPAVPADQPQPYQQQPYPGVPADQAPPYQAQPYQQQPSVWSGQSANPYQPSPATPLRRSPVLGIIGFAVVVGSLLFSFWAAKAVADAIGPLMAIYGAQIDPNDLTFTEQESLAYPTMVGFALAVLGTVGWVLSIVAAARNSGKVWGIAGVVLGFLAPILLLVAFSMALTPFIG